MGDIISYVTTEGESLGSALIEATNSEEPGTWTITGKSAYPYEYNFPNGTTAKAYYQGFYYNRIEGKIDVSLSNIASIGIDLPNCTSDPLSRNAKNNPKPFAVFFIWLK